MELQWRVPLVLSKHVRRRGRVVREHRGHQTFRVTPVCLDHFGGFEQDM